MKLLLYYILHAFKNQIRKLFHTWVIVFILICGLMGGLIGFAAGSLMGDHEEESASVEEAEETEEESPESLIPSDPETVIEESGLSSSDLIELVCGLVILALLFMEIFGADKSGSKIFLPADVNILFPSPLKPQSVLLFRLITRLGLALMASIYLLFEVPVLLNRAGFSFWSILVMILTWFLSLASAKLIQMLLYTLASTRPRMKSLVRRFVYGAALVLVVGFIVYQRSSGQGYLKAASRFFNVPASRFIPVWGWLKGIAMYTLEERYALAALCLCLILIFLGLLIWLIWHVKADFYEEALSRTEETAELLENARQSQESGGLIMKRRKKDRSESLLRDGLNRGQGASVFFWKTIYNRFRFAHLHLFTKTSETYLVAAAGAALISRFLRNTRSVTMVGLVLAGFAFYRALGNPLSKDTETPYFRLCPDPAWKKLLYSLLGGSVDCLLDIIPALLLGMLILGKFSFSAFGWIFFIVSIDFYATAAGVFIDLSVPSSTGRMVKQFVQILFVYFGLIPDAGILLVGYHYGSFVQASIAAFILNILLGTVFLAITPVFLEPGQRSAIQYPAAITPEQKVSVRKHFSRLGLGPFLLLVTASILQTLFSVLLLKESPAWAKAEWAVWVFNFAPIYLVGFPISYLILRKADKQPIPKQNWSPRRLLAVFPICVFLMYLGSLIGNLVTWLVSLFIPSSSAANPILDLVSMDSLFWRILIMVIIAPIVEELLFRKLLIDRMHSFGEKRAVILSALMFGLFHGNFTQMFYAFFLGLVFGYVYLRSGRLRYSIGLHMIINFMGSVIAPEMLTHIDVESLDKLDLAGSGVIPALIYFAILVILFFLGLILFFLRKRDIHYETAPRQLPKKGNIRLICLNPGMLLFLLGCLALMVFSLL